jgi:hypothetical protein
MPRWCGVVVNTDPPYVRPQIRVAQQCIDKQCRPADASPGVVPQRRDQPGPINGEHQIRETARTDLVGIVSAPAGSLLGSGQHQHIRPPRIQAHPGRIGEDDVAPTGLEVSKPPALIRRLAYQRREQRSIVPRGIPAGSRQFNRRVVVEDRWNAGGDCHTDRCARVDPLDVRRCADAPVAAIPDDPLHGYSIDQEPRPTEGGSVGRGSGVVPGLTGWCGRWCRLLGAELSRRLLYRRGWGGDAQLAADEIRCLDGHSVDLV